ncbi:MAG: hypothetical protein EB023_03425 [Flavobacteriia bacterium]|nr:hypothetical protein [Flavobacteriia bacterium]
MRLISFILCALCSVAAAYSQDNTFYRKYNFGGMQGALQLATTLDGGFVATGQHEGNGSAGDCDIYVYKLDVCGNIEWFKIYGTAAQEGGRSIQQTADTGYIVSGLYAQGPNRAFNMKLNPQGVTQWIKLYPFEWMMYAVEAANGDFISVGTGSSQLYIIRTDNQGNLIWSKRIDGLGTTSLYLYELNNGDIMVACIGVGNGKDISLCRLDANGNFLWGKAYGGSGWNDQDHTAWSCKGAVNQTDNSIVLTSPTYLGGMAGENILVTKISLTNGSVQWARAAGGVDRDQSRDIAMYPEGYVILGNTASFPTAVNAAAGITEVMGEKDVLLFAFDSIGNLNWARTYGGADRDKGIGVRYNLDSGFTVSAYTTSPFFGNNDASMDPLFIKTDSVGIVSCQMATPPLQFVPINLTEQSVGSTTTMNFSTSIPPMSVTSITPTDGYLCQQCVSIPVFTPEDTMLCINDTARFFNITTYGLKCFQEWLVEGQTVNGGNDLEWIFTQPGDYQVILYSTCGNSQDTMSTTIHVFDPQINDTVPVCQDLAPFNLTANLPGGIWSGGGIVNASTGLFSPNNAGPGFIPVFYDLPGLCEVSDTFQVNPLPVANAGPDFSDCHILDTIMGAAGQLGQSYLWAPTTNLSNPTLPNPGFYYENLAQTNATFNYTLTVTIDSSGCTDTDVAQMIVTPRPIVNAGPDRAYCDGDLIVLSGSGVQSYVWDHGVVNKNVGTVTYHVIGTDALGCSNHDTVTLIVHPLPNVYGYPDTAVCEDEFITLYGGGAVSYLWNNGVVNAVPFVQNTGNEAYTVIGTDANGCENSDTVYVTVWPKPFASFWIEADNLMHSFYNESQGAVLYSWDFGDGSALESTFNAHHYYPDMQGATYLVSLIASTEYGCLDTAQLQVTGPYPVIIYVPNTFTPDGDERNNEFTPSILGNVDGYNYTFNIYNRWGELIFTSRNIYVGWDGINAYTFRPSQDGVYTWEILLKRKTNDELMKYHGMVNLIR